MLKYAIENVGYDTEKISDFIKNLKEFNGKYEYLIINDNGDMILETIVSRWGDRKILFYGKKLNNT